MRPASTTGPCTQCRTTLPAAAAFCTGCGAPTGGPDPRTGPIAGLPVAGGRAAQHPSGPIRMAKHPSARPTPTLNVPPQPGWHHGGWSGPTPMAAPAPAGRGILPWVAIGVLALLLIAGGAAVVRPQLFGLGTASPIAAPASGSGLDPSSPAPAVDPTQPTTTSDAAQQLRAQADGDRAAVEAATDQWVPQLSSKKPGMVAEGRSRDAAAILQDHQQLRSRYPSAALLWSGDWSVFSASDYWVTVVDQPYATAADANAWCATEGLPANDCFAKKLSHSAGSVGTTGRR